jgi:hypothetical protein
MARASQRAIDTTTRLRAPASTLCGITRGYGTSYPAQSPRFFVSPAAG